MYLDVSFIGLDHTQDPDPGVIAGARQDLTQDLVAGKHFNQLGPDI